MKILPAMMPLNVDIDAEYKGYVCISFPIEIGAQDVGM